MRPAAAPSVGAAVAGAPPATSGGLAASGREGDSAAASFDRDGFFLTRGSSCTSAPRGFTLDLASTNWQKLTNRHAQIRAGPLIDGLATASDAGCDVLLSVELGATAVTSAPTVDDFDADWEVWDRSVPGVGAGAFWASAWQGCWAATAPNGVRNVRFCLLQLPNCAFAPGVFHAPHAGYPMGVRLDFYRVLWREWCRFRASHPQAWGCLAGDANLPNLLHAGQRRDATHTSKTWSTSLPTRSQGFVSF